MRPAPAPVPAAVDEKPYSGAPEKLFEGWCWAVVVVIGTVGAVLDGEVMQRLGAMPIRLQWGAV